jgi:hypothetical protein
MSTWYANAVLRLPADGTQCWHSVTATGTARLSFYLDLRQRGTCKLDINNKSMVLGGVRLRRACLAFEIASFALRRKGLRQALRLT